MGWLFFLLSARFVFQQPAQLIHRTLQQAGDGDLRHTSHPDVALIHGHQDLLGAALAHGGGHGGGDLSHQGVGNDLSLIHIYTEFLEVDEPEDSSAEHVEEIMEDVEPAEPAEVSVERPNIIAIMNESWADFEYYGNLSLSESVTDYISSLDNACLLYTSRCV